LTLPTPSTSPLGELSVLGGALHRIITICFLFVAGMSPFFLAGFAIMILCDIIAMRPTVVIITIILACFSHISWSVTSGVVGSVAIAIATATTAATAITTTTTASLTSASIATAGATVATAGVVTVATAHPS